MFGAFQKKELGKPGFGEYLAKVIVFLRLLCLYAYYGHFEKEYRGILWRKE